MKKQLLLAATVLAATSVSSLANADDNKGVYVRGDVGYGVISSVDLNQDLVGDIEGEGNVTGTLGLGYEFGNNWRIELDAAQLWNDTAAINQNGNTSSEIRINTGMINAIYDFDGMGRWEPYVGAGIGLAEVHFKGETHSSGNPAPPFTPIANPACPSADNCRFDAIDQGFAWQLLAGVGYELTENLTWDTHYRYLNAGSKDYLGQGRDLGAPTYTTLGSPFHLDTTLDGIDSHSIMTGVRYRFGNSAPKARQVMYTCWDGASVSNLSTCAAKPPAPTLVPCWDGSQVESGTACPSVPSVPCWDGSTARDQASCPIRPQQYTCWDGSLVLDLAACPIRQQTCGDEYRQEVIYYEFNKAQSAETREKIERILSPANSNLNCAISGISVVGHTDTSGSNAYNLGLSKRRAAGVRRELIRQGANSSEITSDGKGETQLFIDTGDGKKEALNRRTEVLIRLTDTGVIN